MVNGELQGHGGGSPLLWQHLFWFFGHPEVYIAILPGMGVVSHVLANFSRKPVFGYRAMALALCAIGFLGFLVWGHHMFVSGMNPYSGLTFSLLTMSIGVPSAIKTFNWLGTLWGGKIQFSTPMLFAIGFVSLFVTGGLSGIFLAQPAVDTHAARDVLRGGAFPPGDGRGGDLRDFRGHVLLVPENVRADDERAAWQAAFLAHVCRRLLHLHADAFSGASRAESGVTRMPVGAKYLARAAAAA